MKVAAGIFVPLLVLAAAVISGCGGDGDSPPSPAKGVTEVTRQVLGAAAPEKAPGQSVELTRVVIPAGKDIAPHTHPGPQLAVIVEGTLTYSVLRGEVQVTRAAGTAAAKSETVKAGQSVDLAPGDALAETPGMAHTARNGGKTAVVIYLSSLFPTGAPASSPAD